MKVTFDSNTWRMVASPDKFSSNPIIADYRKIRKAIDDGRVLAYLSETIFTLEDVSRKERKDFLSTYSSSIATSEVDSSDDTMGVSMSIGPNPAAVRTNTGHLKNHFEDAMEAGFRIVRFPRIGGLVNKDVENVRFKLAGQELSNYHDRAFEAGRNIEALNAGFEKILSIANKYAPNKGLSAGIAAAPEHEWGIIASAVAEWADGDSVAMHIGMQNDHFCTLDNAVSGGAQSVFSAANLAILKNQYGFTIISPTDLAKLLDPALLS